MNPLLQLMANSQPVQSSQPNNMMMLAFQAMMSGKSPQEFLKTIPQLQGMDFTNIQGTAQKLCQEKGVNYEQAKSMISNQLNGMK